MEAIKPENARQAARDDARDLILEVWRSVDWQGVTAGRRMGIYDEFGSKIQSAAMTSHLHSFVEKLSRKMGVRGFKRTSIQAVLDRADERMTLDVLRNETSLIVVMMRVWQEEHKLEEALADAGYVGR